MQQFLTKIKREIKGKVINNIYILKENLREREFRSEYRFAKEAFNKLRDFIMFPFLY